MTGADPVAVFDTLASSGVYFNENVIGSYTNQNIRLDPNGTGTIELLANTDVTGDITVSGNISISGDLSKQGNLILGDDIIDGEGNLPENDTVSFAMPLSQSLIPGLDLGYDLGGSLGDSTRGRWAQLHSPSWNDITTIIPSSATVSDQIFIGGALHEITSVQSNDDLVLNADTGIYFIENTKWQDDTVTNLLNTPLRLRTTGIGYYTFGGTNAILIPAGNDATRPVSPELGDTRWNTDQQYLECFDGTIYVVATGGGIEVNTQIMEDLGHAYTLMLG
jgi:hypothetical protein